jgi:hypothetical protein
LNQTSGPLVFSAPLLGLLCVVGCSDRIVLGEIPQNLLADAGVLTTSSFEDPFTGDWFHPVEPSGWVQPRGFRLGPTGRSTELEVTSGIEGDEERHYCEHASVVSYYSVTGYRVRRVIIDCDENSLDAADDLANTHRRVDDDADWIFDGPCPADENSCYDRPINIHQPHVGCSPNERPAWQACAAESPCKDDDSDSPDYCDGYNCEDGTCNEQGQCVVDGEVLYDCVSGICMDGCDEDADCSCGTVCVFEQGLEQGGYCHQSCDLTQARAGAAPCVRRAEVDRRSSAEIDELELRGVYVETERLPSFISHE